MIHPLSCVKIVCRKIPIHESPIAGSGPVPILPPQPKATSGVIRTAEAHGFVFTARNATQLKDAFPNTTNKQPFPPNRTLSVSL